MSRSDELNKMTENVYKGILEQFNPSLKNFVMMGKHYEKALTGVTVAAKGYFDALVKLGELASDSQGSKELGDTLFQMAEVHRQIQVQLEDTLKLFRSELLSQLEQKLDLDFKFLTATLKKYQGERKSKLESIERCQSQLKKLRKKSQASRHPNKYGEREMQFVELVSRRQTELDSLVSQGFRSALTEERRRYCFLIDRQCSVSKILITHHCKVRELLSQKLSSWQQSCAQPTKLPERALNLLRHTAGTGLNITHSPEQRLSVQEVPPLLNGDSSSRPQHQRVSPSDSLSPGLTHYQNGHASSTASPAHSITSPTHSTASPTHSVMSLGQSSVSTIHSTASHAGAVSLPNRAHHSVSPPLNILTPIPAAPPPLVKGQERFSTSTLPLPRRQSGNTFSGFSGSRVEALFSHCSDENKVSGSNLLPFQAGDTLCLLISEPRDGWHYGQNQRTGRKGWFPFSYTQPFPNAPGHDYSAPSPLSKLNSSSVCDLDRTPPAGQCSHSHRLESDEECSVFSQRISSFRPRPYSMMEPQNCSIRDRISTDFTSPPPSPSSNISQVQRLEENSTGPNTDPCGMPHSTTAGLGYMTVQVKTAAMINPFAHIQLRKTVTNDRSAPLIQ
ncbi:hypothetical protein DNTS_002703 [Danionella cerebrum]|uniref:BAR/IMD domain-containing adapter protein 2 n=1 Tax=Danionella cerebrum TaxID=2873325 RepID=A0A553MKU5_9TELE|nr:hypothetical protein DNTS_002703 [Danionella translucida]